MGNIRDFVKVEGKKKVPGSVYSFVVDKSKLNFKDNGTLGDMVGEKLSLELVMFRNGKGFLMGVQIPFVGDCVFEGEYYPDKLSGYRAQVNHFKPLIDLGDFYVDVFGKGLINFVRQPAEEVGFGKYLDVRF